MLYPFPFCSQEIRYFLEEYNNIEALETSLENSPGDVALWIKLARLKLHQNSDDTHAENNIRQALSTLARGLEENAQSEVCWVLIRHATFWYVYTVNGFCANSKKPYYVNLPHTKRVEI